MRQAIKLLLTLICVPVMMIGCSRYDEKILGTWKLDYWMTYSQYGTNGDAVDNYYFIFRKGGKGIMTSPGSVDGESLTTEFDYSIDDDILHMSLRDFENNKIEKLDDTKMLLVQMSATSSTEFGFTKH